MLMLAAPWGLSFSIPSLRHDTGTVDHFRSKTFHKRLFAKGKKNSIASICVLFIAVVLCFVYLTANLLVCVQLVFGRRQALQMMDSRDGRNKKQPKKNNHD